MGGQWSSLDNERETTPDPFWPSTQASTSNEEKSTVAEKANDGPVRLKENKKKLEEFKQELAGKREARHKAMVGLSNKLKQLQQQVDTEAEARCAAEEEVKRLKALLKEKGERCFEEMKKKMEELEKEKEDKENQLHSLRRVASIGKEMLRIRELQVNELKKKLCETAAYPSSLREEYEAQIQNVRRLKTLYEERAEAARLEHQKELEREVARAHVLENRIKELEKEKKNSETAKDQLKCHISKLDEALGEENDQSMTLREQLDASLLECRDLSSQMALVNNLFSKVLLGHIDVNRLTRLLQENQSLMTDLTSNGGARNDLAALLLKIVEQIDSSFSETTEPNQDAESDIMTEEQVAVNLSKVWQILVQLLAKNDPSPSDCDSGSCYKSVETPSGTKSVISVSQTFITLKTLILEKNSLINEVGKLKSLNDHLETRLGSQEKRLAIVSTELKKTWGVVSKLRAQHKQLHTQEKILRYELQHKRQLLTELKEELERCRDKWTMARKKNTQSEEDWRKLRKEFAERKNRQVSTSAESGYEDEELRSPPTEDSLDESCPVESNDDEITENEEVEFSENDLPSVEDEIRSSSRTSFYMSGENHSSSSIQSTDTVIRVDLNDLRFVNESTVTGHDEGNISPDVVNNDQECDRLKDQTVTSSESSTNHDENDSEKSTIIPDGDSVVTHQKEKVNSNSVTCTSSSAENISKFLDGLFAPDYDVTSNGNDLEANSCIDNQSDKTVVMKKVDDDDSNMNFPCDIHCSSHSSSTTNPALFDPEYKEEVEVCVVENKPSRPIKSCHENKEESVSVHSVTEKPKEDSSPSMSPRPSTSSTDEDHKKTPEEILDARTARLKRLEEQCKQLFNKVTATTHKSNVLSTKLDQIHEQYGGGSNQKPDETSTEAVAESTSEEKLTEAASPEQGVQEKTID